MQNSEILEMFKNEGFQTRIVHLREVPGYGLTRLGDIRLYNLQKNIRSNGGLTECHVRIDDTTEIVTRAKCNPKDRYDRKLGTNIALTRALDYIYPEPKV